MSVTPIRPRQGDAPPHDPDAERAALGKCLLDPSLLLSCGLEENDFWLQKHRYIWAAMLWLLADGETIDTIHLSDYLERMERLQVVGGRNYLLDLTDTIPAAVPTTLLRRLRRERDALAIVQRVQAAVAQDDLVEARRALASGLELLSDTKPDNDLFGWRGDLFRPLPPAKWFAKALQVGPGRPAMLAGYGSSAKTLASQALAVAIATGTPAWGHFPTERGKVVHLDYEQGFRATARRYQRLAVGHGLDPREIEQGLRLGVMPRVYLDSPDAIDVYARMCDGVDFVLLDALKGATPTMDENDSSIRTCVDNLTRISEKTGTAFWLLHHAGKPKDGHDIDPRTILRGSSAIFDGCGSVFVVVSGKTNDAPRRVSHLKPSAEAEGSTLDPFSLDVQDYTWGGDPFAGVRVLYSQIEQRSAPQRAVDAYNVDAERVLDFVRGNPDSTQRIILGKVGIRAARALQVLNALTDEGRIRVSPGDHGAKKYRVEVP